MRDDQQRLMDIHQAVTDIEEFVSDLTRATFLVTATDDRKTFRAICDCFNTIGEASNHLSDDFKNANESIDWRRATAMRNMIAHEYFRVDLEVVWATIEREIPPLKTFVATQLQGSTESDQS